jgi:aspartate aminotransferase-like enzyme
MRTLSEYITAEFGIVPDEVQLEQIREIVRIELMGKITREKTKTILDWIKESNRIKPIPYEMSTKIF